MWKLSNIEPFILDQEIDEVLPTIEDLVLDAQVELVEDTILRRSL